MEIVPGSERNAAAIYNRTRRILFSILNGRGKEAALAYLNGVSSTLSRPSYVGLEAELHFYVRYGKQYRLTPSLDAGDKNDFTGIVRGKVGRIDVTTNPAFKRLADYEPFQKEGHDYYIAHVDKDSHDLLDVYDINFPFCGECGSRLFDVLLLLPPEVDSEGMERWDSMGQAAVQLCPGEPDFHSRLIAEAVTPWVFDFDNFFSYDIVPRTDYEEVGAPGTSYGSYDEYVDGEVRRYALENVHYYRKMFDRNLVAIGSLHYEITNPTDGDGFWGTRMYWMDPLVQPHIEDVVEGDLYEMAR